MARPDDHEGDGIPSGRQGRRDPRWVARAGRDFLPPPPTLRQHLATLIAQMRGKDCDARHVAQTERYATRISSLERAEQVEDLNADRRPGRPRKAPRQGIVRPHAECPPDGDQDPGTLPCRSRFCAENPLAALRRFKFNEKADRRLVRRVLTEDEVAALLRIDLCGPRLARHVRS